MNSIQRGTMLKAVDIEKTVDQHTGLMDHIRGGQVGHLREAGSPKGGREKLAVNPQLYYRSRSSSFLVPSYFLLLTACSKQFKLKKVTPPVSSIGAIKAKQNENSDVAQILMRRVAMEMSDSEEGNNNMRALLFYNLNDPHTV